MTTKAILLDCGGVLVKPTTGDWALGPGYETILGESFASTHLDAFRTARSGLVSMLPDANVVVTDEEEYAMFIPLYEKLFDAIGISLPREALEQLAWQQVYHDGRYILFDDVLPMLEAWQKTYKLGIVSDAPPSTRRIMDRMGVSQYIGGATYSCNIGVLKPNPAIYQRTLDLLGVSAGEAIFVDDIPGNLHGAQALGIRAIQMRRPMPPLFPQAPAWDGPIVHNFAELDALLPTL